MLCYTSLDVRNRFAAYAKLSGELGLRQVGAFTPLGDQTADFASLADSMRGAGGCHS